MKFDRPDDDYYRREIGRKLERACLFDSDIEEPSPETVKMWMEKAKELREKRRRCKRLLISSAAVFVLSVGIGATIAFEQPSAEAGNSGEVRIETGMESKDTYASIDEVPETIQENFLVFSEFAPDYNLKKIEVEEKNEIKKIKFNFEGEGNEEIYIEELEINDERGNSQFIDSDAKKEDWYGLDIYITNYDSENSRMVYTFIYDNSLLVNINVDTAVEEEVMKTFVKKYVLEK